MAACGPWVIYNNAKARLADGTMDLDSHSFKVALFQSTSNCGDATLVSALYGSLTNQVASANGYVTGGVAVPATWTQAAATMTFDTANAGWTASGGSIVARYAVMYDDTATNKDLLCYCLLDSAPADVVVSDGNTLTINIVNVFTLT